MNLCTQKNFYSLFAAFTICLLLPSLCHAAPEIRGLTFDTGETSSDEFYWNAATFGGFNYLINKHKDFVASEKWSGERLQYIEKDGKDELGKNNPGNHVIGEGELVYSTRPYSNKYTLVSGLELNANTTPEQLGGMFYYRLPWFGKPYVAVENDARQLANTVINQKSSDKKELKIGETWELGKNYSLTVNQIDTEGNKVWFSLFKNDQELESGIVKADKTVESQTFTATADFGEGKDQLYFITYVDSIFTSATDSFAVFKYTWLIDKDDIQVIKQGDEYQGFKVKKASKDEIVLANSKSINLNLKKDKKTYFTDSWYFQTSDEGKGSTSREGYIIYPATEVTVEDKNASGPKENMTSAKGAKKTNVTETVLNTNDSETVSNESASSVPLVQNNIDDSKSSNNHPEENTSVEASLKTPGLKMFAGTPGFEILAGALGIVLCQALLKRRD
ncbi:MAG: S-layer protein domain-containing protein [Methanosarcina sp.]|jgi:S-layer protein (TIGR01567 family)|nr:S-layer protein domain-containing protein [Methanosarcina sp.]MDD4523005.1 S-layer protein domain-containing protein [Methanosarcina sp.]HHV25187.1 hypothetical protein [Methanosarcina sp.]